jgi:hypothetical protein
VFTAVGLVLALAFGLLQRRELARRRRRRAGLRASAEVVSVRLNPSVHSGAKVSTNLTVEFAGNTVSTTFLELPNTFAEGSTIEVVYDPAEPANFEPVTPAPTTLR